MRGKDLSSLEWQRGYYLVRNKHNPEMMFVISDGFTVPPGWYTDKGGSIRRVS